MADDDVYKRRGFAGRFEYLHSLSEEYGADMQTVLALADVLGPNEDFDGLINMLEELV